MFKIYYDLSCLVIIMTIYLDLSFSFALSKALNRRLKRSAGYPHFPPVLMADLHPFCFNTQFLLCPLCIQRRNTVFQHLIYIDLTIGISWVRLEMKASGY